MSAKEMIEWNEVTERIPEDSGGMNSGDWEPQYVMTQDNEGNIQMYCYVEGGVWMSEDKGYEEELEYELESGGRRIERWAEWPKGARFMANL
jgi:hypothetical protein